jgi:hypothetical protein
METFSTKKAVDGVLHVFWSLDMLAVSAVRAGLKQRELFHAKVINRIGSHLILAHPNMKWMHVKQIWSFPFILKVHCSVASFNSL